MSFNLNSTQKLLTLIRPHQTFPFIKFGVIKSQVIKSQEATTLGDPLAMTMYGVAVLPPIDMVEDQNLTNNWYADEGNVAGSLERQRIVLDKLNEHRGAFDNKVLKRHHSTKTVNSSESEKKTFGIKC